MDDSAELLDSKAELDQEELERLLRENRALKGRLDELERENRLLKQRNFDLSMRYGRSAENRRQPFELVFAGSEDNDNSSIVSDSNELDGNGFSVDESESGREGHSGAESMGDTWARRPGQQQQRQRVEEERSERRREGREGQAEEGGGAGGGHTGTPAAAAGDPAKKERTPEQARRAADPAEADSESAAARERRGVREGDERHGGGIGGGRRNEARQLKCYAELDGHAGAIYSAQYAPTGELVASASFDKTVRIWDVGEQKAVAVLEGHQQSVFDVAWRGDSAAVTSAGFDRTCIEWDVETRVAGRRLECDGLVQCVRYSTHNPRIVYAGDSSGFISILDTRQAQSATRLPNGGAMVNTIFCFNDETRLVSGDRNGDIKMWDVRVGRFMRLIGGGERPQQQQQQQAVSHISVVRNEKSGTEFMAASSYDNVLRVYDRVDDSSVPTPRVIHELRGIPSRNWPIKNAFLDPRMAQEQLVGLYDDDDYYELDMRSQSEARGLRSMLFLLTGSAEPYAYMYRLNMHPKTTRTDDKARRGIRQRLEGHSDRVYAVATHPAETKVCTAGADSTIRLWHLPSAGRLLKGGF
ncbi:hypothetical protein LPJ61_001153 [Coemansia biformis]|uniref:WD40 repeat-like protein n=1 Tax=Coemansia biformis TaxID=1286918 RepID=A0A9W7YEX2_9FUNG|nr:hypothetical protein LPJ61_001153 [Coemansia biformis]